MFYDYWILFFEESFLFLAVCVGLNLKYNFVWSSFGDGINTLIACVFGLLQFIFLLFVAIFYQLDETYARIRMKDKDFIARYARLTFELRFHNSKSRRREVIAYKTF